MRLVWYGCSRNSLLVQTAGLKNMLTPINCHRRCCCCCYCCRLLPLQQQMMIHTGSLALWPIIVRPSPTTATIRGAAAAAIPSIYQLCRPKNNGYMPSPRRICIARPIQMGSTYRTRHSVNNVEFCVFCLMFDACLPVNPLFFCLPLRSFFRPRHLV